MNYLFLRNEKIIKEYYYEMLGEMEGRHVCVKTKVIENKKS